MLVWSKKNWWGKHRNSRYWCELFRLWLEVIQLVINRSRRPTKKQLLLILLSMTSSLKMLWSPKDKRSSRAYISYKIATFTYRISWKTQTFRTVVSWVRMIMTLVNLRSSSDSGSSATRWTSVSRQASRRAFSIARKHMTNIKAAFLLFGNVLDFWTSNADSKTPTVKM